MACLRRRVARHKILDAVGDLYLAGHPIIGVYEAQIRHALNNQLVRARWRNVSLEEVTSAPLTRCRWPGTPVATRAAVCPIAHGAGFSLIRQNCVPSHDSELFVKF
jgi:hypothetical protein